MNINCEFNQREDGKYVCGWCGEVLNKPLRVNCPAKMKQRGDGGDVPPPPMPPELQPRGQNKEPPNLATRLANFAKAAVNHAIQGNPTVEEAVMKRRLEICRACPLFKPNENDVGGVCTHSTCGCTIQDNLNYLNKIAWADQECPIGKWGKEEPNGV
jgi:hypothetical protein